MTFSVGHLVFQLFGNLGVRDELHPERTFEVGKLRVTDFTRPLWPISLIPLDWPPEHGFTNNALARFGK